MTHSANAQGVRFQSLRNLAPVCTCGALNVTCTSVMAVARGTARVQSTTARKHVKHMPILVDSVMDQELTEVMRNAPVRTM